MFTIYITCFDKGSYNGIDPQQKIKDSLKIQRDTAQINSTRYQILNNLINEP
jgi:hypothetical protein